MPKKLKIATMVASEVPIPLPSNFNRAFASIPLAQKIAEGMEKRGHTIHFFATQDSKENKYKLIKAPFKSYWKDKETKEPAIYFKTRDFRDEYLLGSIYLKNKKEKYDLIHLHSPADRKCFSICRLFPDVPVIYTMHDSLDFDWRREMHYLFKTKHQHLVSISDAQRKPAPDLNWIGTVYNGIDVSMYKFNAKPKDYLLFAGRILDRKGVYEAVMAAKKTNSKMIIAGDYYSEKEYWDKKIKPHLSKQIKYVGFVSKKELMKLYRNAKASLMPIKWEEPFGLTFIESMAAGTPPISFDRGSAREIIEDGKSGFVVKDLKGMIKAIENIDSIKREDCREHAEKNFSVDKMVDDYEIIYKKVLKKHGK